MAEKKSGGLHSPIDGRLIAGRYKVVDPEPIGRGGMGLVYRGFDIRTKRSVAIKILHEQFHGMPDVVARFRTETDAVNRVGHEGIVVILDCAQPEETPVFFVMEYLDGKTLAQVLDENGQRGKPLHVQHIRYIGLKLLETLEAVHESGIIHRDLKPENVFILGLLSKRYRVKLLDFGIAKFKEADPKLTQVGTIVGTPLYMSPEQCRGLPVDYRTDLYAIGCILYEMATGRPPFVGDLSEVQQGHLSRLPEAPNDLNGEIPPALNAVIMTALAKEPDNRFRDAETMREALEDAVPEDKMFWRDSRPPSPVNGSRVLATPPRIPTAMEDQPTSERLDSSKTPTRLLADKRPPAGIALAKTMTPADLKRAVDEETAHQFAKNFGVWILKPSSRAAVIAIGSTLLILTIVFVLLAAYPPNTGKRARTADAGVEVSTTAVVVSEKETPPQPSGQPDVIVLPVPVPVPRDDATTDEPNEVVEMDAVETAANAGPPDGYAELLAAAEHARNWRTAVGRLEEATELWPEGPDAWKELGNVFMMHGEIRKAREAFRTCLDLLPPDAFVQRAQVEGRLRGLQ
ncbi:protein kinase [Candidatus Falkowbacteria bacterium]|nr:protein kinase [Candidatus Falkowbacteria bacterium]